MNQQPLRDDRPELREATDDVLTDRTHFVLSAERWDEFMERLDGDERAMPRLAAFLARPSILER